MQRIQAKVHYRIPLVGGFTDYPEFYEKHESKSITCAINKFLTVSVEENDCGGVDVRSIAELPWRAGLGSSGAYYAALISAVAQHNQRNLSRDTIARLAYDLETGIEPHATGRQDSIAALFEGCSEITYFRDGSISVGEIMLDGESRATLNARLLLFDVGERRKARSSIADVFSRDQTPILCEIAKLPELLIQALSAGDIDFLGTALDLQEQYRSRLSPTCRSPKTDRLLEIARDCGAGARLTGAGIGSILCYCHEGAQKRLRERIGLSEIKFSILWPIEGKSEFLSTPISRRNLPCAGAIVRSA